MMMAGDEPTIQTEPAEASDADEHHVAGTPGRCRRKPPTEIAPMAEYAFPKDLLGGIKDRWDAVPARQGFELPDEPTLLELLETC